jgi:hypothetical protein
VASGNELHGDGTTEPVVLVEAQRRIRAPWAAGIAGLLFAIMYTAALVLLRGDAIFKAGDAALAQLYARGEDLPAVIGGLYLAPFAGIMFLWLIAVIRDQIGELEDQFFATVFLGSGVLFVGLLFTAAAIATAPSVGFRYLGHSAPSAATIDLLRSLAYTVTFAFENRAAGVFLFATATIGLKSGVFPRWFALASYALGVVLIVAVTFLDWAILVLPVWVAIVSLLILRRERARRRAA